MMTTPLPRVMAALALLASCAPSAEPPIDSREVIDSSTSDASSAERDALVAPSHDAADSFSVDPELPCPTGHALRESGACIPVGIQGCAEMFINPVTGLCEPGPEDCPPGHIADFSAGCTSVNLPGCVDAFINPETGLCDPKPEDCPPGHMPVFDEGCVRVGVTDCHPSFVDPLTGHCEVDPSLCGDNELPVPTQGCVSLDPPAGCGEGPFGNIAPMSGDVFIDPSASTSGADGSQGAPYATLAKGLRAVTQGGRLVLASGTYPESLPIDASISVIGRCSSMVTLTGPPGADPFGSALVQIEGAHVVRLTDLSLSPETIGMHIALGAQVTLERVRVKAASDKGIVLTGSGTSLSASRLQVSDTLNIWDYSGYGIEVLSGAALTLTESALLDNTSAGIFLQNVGTEALIQDVAVIGTMPEFDGWSGMGIWAQYGASVTLEESVILDSYASGLNLLLAPSSGTLREVYVARTRYASQDYQYGVGLEVSGGTLTLESVVLSDNQGGGLNLFDGAQVDAKYLFAHDNQTDINGYLGAGINVVGGSTMTLEGATMAANHSGGIIVSNAGSHAELSDLLVTGGQASVGGRDGVGIWVGLSSAITLRRAIVTDNLAAGVALVDTLQESTLSDLVIARTMYDGIGQAGPGLLMERVGDVKVERAAVHASHGAGVLVTGAAADVTLSDLLVTETMHSPNGANGMSIAVRLGAKVSLQRAALLGSFYAGAWLDSTDTAVDFDAVMIAGSRPSATQKPGGVGLLVALGAGATMTQSAIIDNVEVGVDVVQSSMALTQSIVSQTRAGDDERYGDGVIAVQQSVAELKGVVTKGNARAGIFFGQSGGSLSQCLAMDNTMGLVTQGAHESAPLDIADDNITVNNLQNRMSDQDLDIPNFATETPSL